MGFTKFLLCISTFLIALNLNATVRVKTKISQGKIEILSADVVPLATPANPSLQIQNKKILRSLPYFIGERKDYGPAVYEESLVPDSQLTPAILQSLTTAQISFALPTSAEFREIIVQGPKENRINLTIVGDGYKAAEKEKFFADAKRTAEGLFVGQTFASYLPLFNIYAVFVASNESGIGDGSPKDTAFGLFRDPKGSKRAIMPGNESAIDAALKSAPATDYPIVIANDEFYGGLGGRYAISTSSERSGLIVLRHELGHNFGQVGEEYDNGSVYMGANSSSSTSVKWKQWIQGNISVNESKILSGDYVWQNLSKPYQAQFKIPAGFDLMFLTISSVGWETSGDVSVQLNGKDIPLIGDFHNDRAFYSTAPVSVVSGQNYNLGIKQNLADGDNVLGFAEAFAAPLSYDFTPNKVGAFSTFDSSGRKTYRPTHESCIMRDMLAVDFCSVDKENMWLHFLNRVKLIDGLDIQGNQVKLASQNIKGLEIRWYKVTGQNEIEMPEFYNQSQWENKGLKGNFVVRVKFSSPEIRLQSPLLSDLRKFSL